MEQYSLDLYTNWAKIADVTLAANKKGNWYMPVFFLRVAFLLLFSSKYDRIHLGDGALAMFIPIIKLFSKAKVTITLHGLDITYNKFGYNIIFPKLINLADQIICISKYTKKECLNRKIDKKKIKVIPNAIDFKNLKKTSTFTKSKIEDKYNISFKNKSILFSLSRLVKRKGHIEFIEKYMTKLPKKNMYFIGGEGQEKQKIRKTIEKYNLQKQVYLLGHISHDEKVWWLQNADAFIMPNIEVKNDPEGFGITAIEAGAYGLPIYTSGIEGISEAIILNKTGWKLEDLQKMPHKVHTKLVKQKYSWENVIKKYQ